MFDRIVSDRVGGQANPGNLSGFLVVETRARVLIDQMQAPDRRDFLIERGVALGIGAVEMRIGPVGQILVLAVEGREMAPVGDRASVTRPILRSRCSDRFAGCAVPDCRKRR
jgi:hypothetical protein